ncbi:MAG: hypothetical protein RMJ87_04585 [Cytophagales bacterium]|nr:hypothetical protein [Bernardetiaceae bacterium]MDW8204288.1 hypothetical protein [Cytophagales bacterium]
MEKNFDDLLAQKFKTSLENYPVECPPHAWREFEKHYWKKQPYQLIAWWQQHTLRIAAAVLLTTTGILVWYYYAQQQQEPTTAITSIDVPRSAQNSADSTAVWVPTPQPPIVALNTPNSPTMPSNQKQAAVKTHSKTTKWRAATAALQDITIPEPNQFAVAELPVTKTELVELAPTPLLPLPSSDTTTRLVATQALASNSATTQPVSILKIQPGVQLCSGVITGKDATVPSVFYGAGLGIEWWIQPQIALTTNLQMVQTTYETPKKRFRVFNSMQRDPTDRQQFSPVYAEETVYGRVRLNLVQIPLTIKCLIGRRFFLNTGGVSYIAANGTYAEKIVQNTLMGRLHHPVNSAAHTLQPFRTIYVGGGMRLPFKGAILHIEPHVNLPLGDLLHDVNNTSLQWVGMNLGLYYGSAN